MNRILGICLPLLFLVSSPAIFAARAACDACDLIEKMGDGGLEELKRMPRAELVRTDGEGATPFFWSVIHGSTKVRDFLVKTLKKEELISPEKATELYAHCARLAKCHEDTIELLHQWKFAIGKTALPAAVGGSEECSLSKFKLLLKAGAPIDGSDEKGFNVLHQIVDRSRMGRPIFPRECLVSALKLAKAQQPSLAARKNKAGQTPFEFAMFLKKYPNEFGSGVSAKDLDPIIAALR